MLKRTWKEWDARIRILALVIMAAGLDNVSDPGADLCVTLVRTESWGKSCKWSGLKFR